MIHTLPPIPEPAAKHFFDARRSLLALETEAAKLFAATMREIETLRRDKFSLSNERRAEWTRAETAEAALANVRHELAVEQAAHDRTKTELEAARSRLGRVAQ